MILQELTDELDEKADELEVEGINCVDYFARRFGLTDRDLMDFALECCQTNYENNSTIRDAMVTSWLEGFMIGVMAGRRRGAWRS